MADRTMSNNRGAKGMFWGVLFIAVGAVIIINMAFGIHLPIFRVLLGVFFVYMGVKMIVGGSWGLSMHGNWGSGHGNVIFSSGQYAPQSIGDLKGREFNTVFGSGELDLSHTEMGDGEATIEVNTVFGDSTVIIPADSALETQVNSVFGSVELPNDSATAKGNKKVRLKINSVFASVRVIRAQVGASTSATGDNPTFSNTERN